MKTNGVSSAASSALVRLVVEQNRVPEGVDHGLHQGKILKEYLVSAVTAIPVAVLLVYVIGAILLGMLFYAYGTVAGLAYFIRDLF